MALRKGLFEDWRKSQNLLSAQGHLAPEFSLSGCGKKDFHPEKVPQKSGKEAVPACQ